MTQPQLEGQRGENLQASPEIGAGCRSVAKRGAQGAEKLHVSLSVCSAAQQGAPRYGEPGVATTVMHMTATWQAQVVPHIIGQVDLFKGFSARAHAAELAVMINSTQPLDVEPPVKAVSTARDPGVAQGRAQK